LQTSDFSILNSSFFFLTCALMDNTKIVSIEWGTLEGQRPRKAGSNARLGDHGPTVQVPLARITTDDGSAGFGICRPSENQAAKLLGRRFDEVFSVTHGVADEALVFDYPLWDMAARRRGKPVYALAAANAGHVVNEPLRIPCYDTSLYIDDLHLSNDDEGAALIAEEALAGVALGHRAFKIKVGRGARHMPVEEGTRRDIAVIKAVRAAVGPDARIMIDANNGYTLNLAKRVLRETAECKLFWLEEAFHEDAVLYRDLQAWLKAEGLTTLVADGEGEASTQLLRWAQDGLINVVQYDYWSYGFTRWLALGEQLDLWNVRSAPHHYGTHYGNYASCHLAADIRNFALVEWDEVVTPGLNAPGYSIQNGQVLVPATPGFGLKLEEEPFQKAVAEGGFVRALA